MCKKTVKTRSKHIENSLGGYIAYRLVKATFYLRYRKDSHDGFVVGFVFRLIQLMEEIMAEKENKTIIFVETKRRCDDLTRRMRRDG